MPFRKLSVAASAAKSVASRVRSYQAKAADSGTFGSFGRSRDSRLIAGVCGGIAEALNVSPMLVRGLMVASCVLPGPQFLLYIAAWILIPQKG